jgi:hypothetical protein
MKNVLSFVKIAGIQVYIHWTFPIILIWIIPKLARAFCPRRVSRLGDSAKTGATRLKM